MAKNKIEFTGEVDYLAKLIVVMALLLTTVVNLVGLISILQGNSYKMFFSIYTLLFSISACYLIIRWMFKESKK